MWTEPFWIVLPENLTGRLATMPRPRGNDWLEDELKRQKWNGADIVVSALQAGENRELGLVDEAELCSTLGLRFLSFPIEDIGVPDDRRRFTELTVELAQNVEEGASVVIHCRQGIGRASLIAAGVLFQMGVNEPWAAVTTARGRPVPDTEAQKRWWDLWAEDLETSSSRSRT